MKEAWVDSLLRIIAALAVLAFGLLVGFLVGFYGAVMIAHGDYSGVFLILVALGCVAVALGIFAALLPGGR